MMLTYPTYLIGLLGLLIPLAIHLWSKKTRKKINFGSLQFLEATETTTMRSIRPNELLLLILRLIIVMLVVGLLCLPVYNSNKVHEHAFIIDPTYRTHPAISKLADSVHEKTLFSFVSEIPPFKDATDMNQGFSKWAILEEVNELPFKEVTILSPGLIKDYKGSKTNINKDIRWASLPETNQNTTTVGRFSKANASYVIHANGTSKVTSFSHELSNVGQNDSLHLEIFIKADEKYRNLEKNIKATIRAIDKSSLVSLRLTPDSVNTDWSFLLSDEQGKKRENTFFLDQEEPAIAKVSKNIYQLGFIPSTKDFLEKNLHLAIEQILTEGLIDVDPFDQRQLPIATFSAAGKGSETNSYHEPLENWLWVMLVFFILSERFTASNLFKK